MSCRKHVAFRTWCSRNAKSWKLESPAPLPYLCQFAALLGQSAAEKLTDRLLDCALGVQHDYARFQARHKLSHKRLSVSRKRTSEQATDVDLNQTLEVTCMLVQTEPRRCRADAL